MAETEAAGFRDVSDEGVLGDEPSSDQNIIGLGSNEDGQQVSEASAMSAAQEAAAPGYFQSSATLLLSTERMDEGSDVGDVVQSSGQMEGRETEGQDNAFESSGSSASSTMEDPEILTNARSWHRAAGLQTSDSAEQSLMAYHEPDRGQIQARRGSPHDDRQTGHRPQTQRAMTFERDDPSDEQTTEDSWRAAVGRRSSASVIRSLRPLMSAHRRYSTMESISDASEPPSLERQSSALDIMLENKEKGGVFQ